MTLYFAWFIKPEIKLIKTISIKVKRITNYVLKCMFLSLFLDITKTRLSKLDYSVEILQVVVPKWSIGGASIRHPKWRVKRDSSIRDIWDKVFQWTKCGRVFKKFQGIPVILLLTLNIFFTPFSTASFVDFEQVKVGSAAYVLKLELHLLQLN